MAGSEIREALGGELRRSFFHKDRIGEESSLH